MGMNVETSVKLLPVKEKTPHVVTSIPAPEKVIDNDVSYYLCSLISELDKEGFNINDFKYEK